MTPTRGARIELRAGDAVAVVDPLHGGMLTSLRVRGRELLVQATTDTGPVPEYGSFLMAPWVAELYEGRLAFRGRHFNVPRNVGRHAMHGLVLRIPWEVERSSRMSAALHCTLPPAWPFGGLVRQEIEIDPDGLRLTAEIRATDQAMPAALGWHPWFRCPDPSDVWVRVDASDFLELDDDLIPTGRIVEVAGDTDLRAGAFLGDRQIDVVYRGVARAPEIRFPRTTLHIELDPAIDLVVVYTSAGAVCVEPWSAWPAFRQAEAGFQSGATILEPGESLRRWTRWAWSAQP